MPIHGAAYFLEGRINYPYAITAIGVFLAFIVIKQYAAGRKNTWNRDWAGKHILVIVSQGQNNFFGCH